MCLFAILCDVLKTYLGPKQSEKQLKNRTHMRGILDSFMSFAGDFVGVWWAQKYPTTVLILFDTKYGFGCHVGASGAS